MLKRSAILKVLLIGILASVFLLMLSGTVKAEVVWDIQEKKELWWNDEIGDKFSGSENGVNWEAVVITEDTESESGTVSFRITNAESLSGTIEIPDKIQIPRNLLTNWNTYIYKVVKLGTDAEKNNAIDNPSTETKPTKITKVKIGKYVSAYHMNTFDTLPGLKEIEVNSENTTYSSQDGVLYNKAKTKLLKYPIAKSTSGFTIPNSVVIIGSNAFKNNNTNETRITIPKSVTTIEQEAFSFFKGLKVIEFEQEANITNIGRGAFYGCTSLEKFPKLSNITSIPADLFNNCTSLNEVILGEKVTSIGEYAFYKTNISQITIPNTVTKIDGHAFGKSYLNEIDLNNVKTLGEGVFKDCLSLNKVTLSDDLTSISNKLFYGCTKLTDINMPSKLTSIGELAFYMAGLTNIEIPKGVTTMKAGAFLGCPNLITVVIPSTSTTIGDNVFYHSTLACNNNLIVYCTNESAIKAKTPAYIVYEEATDYVTLKSFKDNNGKVTQIDLLNKIYGLPVRVIGEAAFKGSTKLNSVTIPDTVTDIQKEAFSGCIGLTEMILPSELTTIGEKAFYDCTGMKSIIIQKGTPIETIGADAFKNCTGTIYYDGTNSAVNDYAANNSNVNIVIDNTAPIATIGKERPAGKYYMTIKLTNIKDNASGAYKYVVTSKADPSTVTAEEWKLITGETVEEDIKENGTHFIYIMDRAGNIAVYSVIITEVDTIKPQIGEIENITGGKVATIKVKATEEAGGSGLDSYYISMEEKDVSKVTTGWKTISASGTEYTIEDTITSARTWYLYVKDKAGNISDPKEIVIENKYIDSIAPVVQALLYETDRNNEQNKVYFETVKYSVTDSGIGVAGYAIDTKETTDEATRWIIVEGNPGSYEFTYTYESNATYYIHAKDVYGNVSNTEYTENKIEGDYIAPRVEFGIKTADDKVEVILIDANSGLATGANIGYAWSTSNTEAPADEAYSTATLSYANKDKEASFKVDGNSLTGTYYLWVKIGTLKDVDGNENKTGRVVSGAYTFDNTPPTITETKVSKEIIKENGTTTYTITTSEEVTLDSEITPYVTNDKFVQDADLGTLGTLTGSGSTWTVTFTAGTSEGPVVLVLPKGLFKDSVGNLLEETKITKVKVDNTSFEFKGFTLSKGKVNKDGEAIYTFTTDEKLTLVEAKKESVTLTGEGITGTVTDIRENVNGNKWTFTVIGGEGNGAVTLNLPKGLFLDEAGNESNEQKITGLSFDNIAPTVNIVGIDNKCINKDGKATYTITSEEKIIKQEGIEASLYPGEGMGTFSSATLTTESKSEDGKTWGITVTNAIADGRFPLEIPEGMFIDEAGNKCAYVCEKAPSGEGFLLTIDNTPPNIVSVSEPTLSEDNASASIVITTDKKEAKYVVSANDSVENVTEEWKKASSATMIAKVESNGEFYVYVKDEAGNVAKYSEAIQVTEIIDNIAPTIKIEAPNPSSIRTGEKATFRIITSEAVTKVEGCEATVTGEGNTVELTGEKTLWLATVTAGPTEGEVELVLPKAIFKDTSNNSSLEQVTKSGLTIDNRAPEATVKYEQTNNGIKVIITANEALGALEGWTLTKTDKENDTLVKEIREDLSEVTIKDIAGNEAKVATNVKFATAINLNESATVDAGQSKALLATITPIDATAESIKWTSSNTSIVTVDGNGIIKGISKGTATVTACSIKDYTIKATCQITVNDKVPVTGISFGEETTKELILNGTAELAGLVKISPENASDKDVKWSSDNTAVVTVDENGRIKAVGTGTATITVTSVDGEKEAKLKVTVKSLASTEVTGVSLNKKTIRLVKGNTEDLTATVQPETVEDTLKAVVWSSTNEKVATVNNGKVTAVGKGEATITVTTINGGKTATCKVYVEESNVELQSIAFEKSETQIVEGYSETLKVKFTPSNAINQNVTFTSSDETVATVDENGKVEALVPGNTTITATAEEGGYTATCEVTVIKAIPVEKIELDSTAVDLYTGDSKTLVANVLPETATNKELTWSSNNEKVATVNNNGKITAIGKGTAIITVTSKVDGITEICTVTVTDFIKVKSVSINQNNVDIMKNSDIILKATLNPENATNQNITWTSDNEAVAKVEAVKEPGCAKVTGVGNGIATITVTTEDGNKTATCKVTVKTGTEQVTEVTLSSQEMTLPIGRTTQITATVNPPDAANKAVIWKSSNEKVATVDESGMITAVAEGTAIITVTTVDGNLSANCSITVVKQAIGFKEDADFGMKIVDGVQYLVGINPKTAIQSILDKVDEGYTATVENANGAEITDFTKYASTNNTRITVTNGTETITYIVVVKGDCTGDGLVSSLDLIGAVRQYKYVKTNGAKGNDLEGANLLAIKFTEANEYTALDLIGEVRMYKQWKDK